MFYLFGIIELRVMTMIIDYIKATTNLYGIVSKDKVIEIYNRQNDESITMVELENVVGEDRGEFPLKYHLGIYQNKFVSLKIDLVEHFDQILEIQKDKPCYIPEKEELLKYVDSDYFHENKAYTEMLAFLKTVFFRKSKAEKFAKEMHRSCVSLITFHDFMAFYFDAHKNNARLNRKGSEFLHLLTKLRYNTRVFELNGYTAEELKGVVDSSEIEQLINYDVE